MVKVEKTPKRHDPTPQPGFNDVAGEAHGDATLPSQVHWISLSCLERARRNRRTFQCLAQRLDGQPRISGHVSQ